MAITTAPAETNRAADHISVRRRRSANLIARAFLRIERPMLLRPIGPDAVSAIFSSSQRAQARTPAFRIHEISIVAAAIGVS